MAALLALACVAWSQESQPAPVDAADVVAAHESGEPQRMKTLAARLADDPSSGDPWLLAERVLAIGKPADAMAFASASHHAAFDGLAEYVAAAETHTDATRRAAALAAGDAAIHHEQEGDLAAAATALARASENLGEGGGLTSIWLDVQRGNVLARTGDTEGSRRLLTAASKAAEGVGWLRGAAEAYNGLGVCAQNPPDHEALAAAYTKVASLRERIGDSVGASRARTNLAVTHAMFGDFATALPQLERASALLGPHADDPARGFDLGHLLMTQGGVHSRLGESAKAAVALQRSLRLMQEHGSDEHVAQILGDLGESLRRLGDYEQALAVQRRLLELQQRREDRAGIALARANHGQIQYELGDWAQAIASLETAHALWADAGDTRRADLVQLDLGRVARERGDLAQAEKTLRAAVERIDREGPELARAYGRAELGRTQSAMGKHEDALATHRAGLSSARELGQTDDVVAHLSGIAGAQLALGEHAAAVRAAREAVLAQVALIRDAAAAQAPLARRRRSEVYAIGARAARAASDLDSLCFFIESGRAGALLETMRGRDEFRAAAVPDALHGEDLVVRRARADAEQALRDAYEQGLARAEIRARRTALVAAQEREADVTGQIEREQRLAAEMLYPEPADLARLKSALAPGDVLILYLVLPSESLALVVPGGDTPPRVAELAPAADLAAACVAVREAAGHPPRSAAPDLDSAVKSLRDAVLSPLDLGAATRRVIVSPDGPLGHTPFGLLAADLEFVFVPSGTAWLALTESAATPGKEVLAVGDPAYPGSSGLVRLPATRKEVAAIPAPVRRLLGEDATLSAFRDLVASAPRWRALHLACHGLLADDPWRSALALTPSPTDDGRLTALDVVGLAVPADLAVLSACESGRGTLLQGEGMVGLTHGFLGAGASRVVVGLWKVDDAATAAFMAAFYESWITRKTTVPAALRAAQRAVSSEPQWTHPYYWAAWVQWGAP